MTNISLPHPLKPLLVVIFLMISLLFPVQSQAQQKVESHPFASEIKAFEKQDATNPPPKNAILFVGSSSIRKWTTLQQDFPDKKVINRGFGGSQFPDLLYYADRIVFSYHPRQIFVYEGDNDLAAGILVKTVTKNFKKFVRLVQQKLQGTEVVFISIKPSIARKNLLAKMARANNKIQAYSRQTDGVRFVDVYDAMLDGNGGLRPIFQSDNLHMNPAGYDIWQHMIWGYLSDE